MPVAGEVKRFFIEAWKRTIIQRFGIEHRAIPGRPPVAISILEADIKISSAYVIGTAKGITFGHMPGSQRLINKTWLYFICSCVTIKIERAGVPFSVIQPICRFHP